MLSEMGLLSRRQQEGGGRPQQPTGRGNYLLFGWLSEVGCRTIRACFVALVVGEQNLPQDLHMLLLIGLAALMSSRPPFEGS